MLSRELLLRLVVALPTECRGDCLALDDILASPAPPKQQQLLLLRLLL